MGMRANSAHGRSRGGLLGGSSAGNAFATVTRAFIMRARAESIFRAQITEESSSLGDLERRGSFAVVANLFCITLLLAGCAGTLIAHAEVVRPAQVPVRVFPRILVLDRGTEETRIVARAAAAHLRGGRSEVDLVSEEEIEVARTRREGAVSVILRVEVILEGRTAPDWGPRNEMICGPLGCVDDRRPFVEQVPVIEGTLRVEVEDLRSGRSLQEESLLEEASGMDEMALRLRVLERLTERMQALLDQRPERVAVELLPLADPEVQSALNALVSGDWADGRRALETYLDSPAFEALPRQHRAWVLYDLGQATRFDPSLPEDRRLDAARERLYEAVRLSPEPRIADALTELESQRRSLAMVREQDAATHYNFALRRRPGEGARDVPTPPPAYGD